MGKKVLSENLKNLNLTEIDKLLNALCIISCYDKSKIEVKNSEALLYAALDVLQMYFDALK